MARVTLRTLQFETLTPPCAILAFLPLIEGVLGVVLTDDLGKVAMSGVVTSSRKMLRWQGSGEGEERQKEDGSGEELVHCE